MVKVIKMEFKRNSVIALYLTGKLQSGIVNEVRHLRVNKMFFYWIITCYNDDRSINKQHEGRLTFNNSNKWKPEFNVIYNKVQFSWQKSLMYFPVA